MRIALVKEGRLRKEKQKKKCKIGENVIMRLFGVSNAYKFI